MQCKMQNAKCKIFIKEKKKKRNKNWSESYCEDAPITAVEFHLITAEHNSL